MTAMIKKWVRRTANGDRGAWHEHADLGLTHSLHHQLAEGFHVRWLEAAFALHEEDFLVIEEVSGIAHDEGGFALEWAGQFHG